MKHHLHLPPPAPHRMRAQSGMSLIFALLALVAMSLGAVALIRSVDTGTLVLGNLSFKQDATVSADEATEDAIGWLNGASTLDKDSNTTPAAGGRLGYYANSHPTVDVTGQQTDDRELVDWEGDNKCAFAADTKGSCVLDPHTVRADANGKLQYVIFRLCNKTGAITDDSACIKPSNASNASTKRGKLDYSDYARFTNPAGPYYRIVVRAVSARNTTSFTETFVHF